MLKRLIAIILSCALVLTGCAPTVSKSDAGSASSIDSVAEEDNISFSGLDDEDLLTYLEDDIYAELESKLGSDDYIVEGITATYLSKEYIEELSYNSKSNVFFGYTLEELESQFEGNRYIFTLGNTGQTNVQELETVNDEAYAKVIKNVAVGSGVILVCATVSVVTAGTAPAISVVFAASATSGTALALESGVLGGVAAGIARGYQTHDFDEALKAAALSGSDNFKWGAIGGAVAGGVDAASSLRKASKTEKSLLRNDIEIPTPRESELRAKEKFGGEEQKSYLNGEEVSYGTANATRPDLVRMVDGHLEADEVKSYDLVNHKNQLCTVLRTQIEERKKHMPNGTTQRVVLDVKGRGYDSAFVEKVIVEIQKSLYNTYPDIPIAIMW